MGGNQSADFRHIPRIQLIPNQRSLSDGGAPCIKTGPLRDVSSGLTLQKALDEADIYSRYPVPPGTWVESCLKYVEYGEPRPDTFTTKVVLDGRKLDAMGRGRGDGMDLIAIWTSCTNVFIPVTSMSKKELECSGHFTRSSANYVCPIYGAWTDDVSVQEGCFSLRDPKVRFVTYAKSKPEEHLELCMDFDDGHDDYCRVASKELGDVLEFFADVTMAQFVEASKATVQVASCCASLRDPEKLSNVSEVISPELVEFDALFRCLLKVVEQRGGDTLVPMAGSMVGIGETSLLWGVRIALGDQQTPSDHRIQTQISWTKESGDIRVQEMAVSPSGQVLQDPSWSRLTQVVVHQDPLRIESWEVHESGARLVSAVAARLLQKWVNEALGMAIGKTIQREVDEATPCAQQ